MKNLKQVKQELQPLRLCFNHFHQQSLIESDQEDFLVIGAALDKQVSTLNQSLKLLEEMAEDIRSWP